MLLWCQSSPAAPTDHAKHTLRCVDDQLTQHGGAAEQQLAPGDALAGLLQGVDAGGGTAHVGVALVLLRPGGQVCKQYTRGVSSTPAESAEHQQQQGLCRAGRGFLKGESTW